MLQRLLPAANGYGRSVSANAKGAAPRFGVPLHDYLIDGIQGVIVFGGNDCTFTGNVVEGSWFFVPYDFERTYWFDPGQLMGEWRPETNYARYGYWLSGDPANPALHVYAMKGEDGSYVSREGPVDDTVHETNGVGLNLGVGPGEVLQATYSG